MTCLDNILIANAYYSRATVMVFLSYYEMNLTHLWKYFKSEQGNVETYHNNQVAYIKLNVRNDGCVTVDKLLANLGLICIAQVGAKSSLWHYEWSILSIVFVGCYCSSCYFVASLNILIQEEREKHRCIYTHVHTHHMHINV